MRTSSRTVPVPHYFTISRRTIVDVSFGSLPYCLLKSVKDVDTFRELGHIEHAMLLKGMNPHFNNADPNDLGWVAVTP